MKEYIQHQNQLYELKYLRPWTPEGKTSYGFSISQALMVVLAGKDKIHLFLSKELADLKPSEWTYGDYLEDAYANPPVLVAGQKVGSPKDREVLEQNPSHVWSSELLDQFPRKITLDDLHKKEDAFVSSNVTALWLRIWLMREYKILQGKSFDPPEDWSEVTLMPIYVERDISEGSCEIFIQWDSASIKLLFQIFRHTLGMKDLDFWKLLDWQNSPVGKDHYRLTMKAFSSDWSAYWVAEKSHDLIDDFNFRVVNFVGSMLK